MPNILKTRNRKLSCQIMNYINDVIDSLYFQVKVYIYIYSYSRRFYSKRLTVEEYNKRFIIKRQINTWSAGNTQFHTLFRLVHTRLRKEKVICNLHHWILLLVILLFYQEKLSYIKCVSLYILPHTLSVLKTKVLRWNLCLVSVNGKLCLLWLDCPSQSFWLWRALSVCWGRPAKKKKVTFKTFLSNIVKSQGLIIIVHPKEAQNHFHRLLHELFPPGAWPAQLNLSSWVLNHLQETTENTSLPSLLDPLTLALCYFYILSTCFLFIVCVCMCVW